MVKLIDGAQSYIYAAFYNLNLLDVAKALINVKNRKVDVRVMVDSDNMGNPTVNKLQMVVSWWATKIKTTCVTNL